MPGSVKNKKRHQSKVLSKDLSKKLGIEKCQCPEKAQMYIALWGKSTSKPYLVRVIEVEEDSTPLHLHLKFSLLTLLVVSLVIV